MGKWLDGRLKSLGATPLLKLACADEATGLEDVVEPWCAALYELMPRHFSGDGSATISEGGGSAGAVAEGGKAEAALARALAAADAAADALVPCAAPSPFLVARGVASFDACVGGHAAAREICRGALRAAVVAELGGGAMAAAAADAPALHRAAGLGLFDAALSPPSPVVAVGSASGGGGDGNGNGGNGNGTGGAGGSGGGALVASFASARYLTAGGAWGGRRVVHASLAVSAQAGPSGGGGGGISSGGAPAAAAEVAEAQAVAYKVGDAVGLKCPNAAGDVASVLSCLATRAHADDAQRLATNAATSDEAEALGSAVVSLSLSRSGQAAPMPDCSGAVGRSGSSDGGSSSSWSSGGDPGPTVLDLLTWGVDLCGAVRPPLCAALAACAGEARDKARLLALALKPPPALGGSKGQSVAFDAFVAGQVLNAALKS